MKHIKKKEKREKLNGLTENVNELSTIWNKWIFDAHNLKMENNRNFAQKLREAKCTIREKRLWKSEKIKQGKLKNFKQTKKISGIYTQSTNNTLITFGIPTKND